VQEKQPFERIEVSRAEALEMFAENKFKATFLAPVLFISFFISSCCLFEILCDLHSS